MRTYFWIKLVITILIICKVIAVRVSFPGENLTAMLKRPYPGIYSLDKGLLPEPMLITSRPLSFISEDDTPSDDHIPEKSASVSGGKESSDYIPGVATLVCKGTSCGKNDKPFNHGSSLQVHDGFPGEAIPVSADDQYFSVQLQNSATPSLLPPAVAPPQSSHPPASTGQASTTLVKLLTKRPYQNRKGSTKSRASPTRKSIIRSTTRPTTTRTRVPLVTRRRSDRTSTTTTSTTSRPLAAPANAARIPTITFRRPSLFFPAAAAFTMVALPVAAAAVPLLFAAGRKKRSVVLKDQEWMSSVLHQWQSSAANRWKPSVTNQWPVDQPVQSSDLDFKDILRDIEEFENSHEQLDQKFKTNHLTRARQWLQNAQNYLNRDHGR